MPSATRTHSVVEPFGSSDRPPRIGLVLGGGGLAGVAFHVGSLAAIQEVTGWDPRTAEVIVGTSAGSNIAAMLRGNVSTADLVDRTLSLPTDPEGMRRLREVSGRGLSLLTGAVAGPTSLGLVAREALRGPFARPMNMFAGAVPPGIVPTDVSGELADSLHSDEWPDQLTWLTAVSLDDGELTVFGRDDMSASMSQAVQASCAIPGYFTPVEIGGRRYVDGGVRSATNADMLVGHDLDLVVTLSPLSLDRARLRAPIASVVRAVPALRLRAEIKALREDGLATLTFDAGRQVVRATGANPMDPTRIVSVLLSALSSLTDHLEDRENSRALATLRRAGAELESPSDVPYPLWS